MNMLETNSQTKPSKNLKEEPEKSKTQLHAHALHPA